MNYKTPKNSTNNIYRILNDLAVTRLEIEDEFGIFRHNLIAEDYYDKDTGRYIVRIPSITAKYHIFNWGIQIPREVNREIILIPDKLSKLKALISFIPLTEFAVEGRYAILHDDLDNVDKYIMIVTKLLEFVDTKTRG